MSGLVLALFLSLLNNRIVDFFFGQLWDKLKWDRFYLMYVAAVTGMVISILARVQLLAGVGVDIGYWPDVILSGLIVGGGSNLIHDIFDKEPETPPA
jgi:hypothetical protein